MGQHCLGGNIFKKLIECVAPNKLCRLLTKWTFCQQLAKKDAIASFLIVKQ
jgi:hypothetical protein